MLRSIDSENILIFVDRYRPALCFEAEHLSAEKMLGAFWYQHEFILIFRTFS